MVVLVSFTTYILYIFYFILNLLFSVSNCRLNKLFLNKALVVASGFIYPSIKILFSKLGYWVVAQIKSTR